jgi:hypothetical protein
LRQEAKSGASLTYFLTFCRGRDFPAQALSNPRYYFDKYPAMGYCDMNQPFAGLASAIVAMQKSVVFR